MPRISIPPTDDPGAATGALMPEVWNASRAYAFAVYSHTQIPVRELEGARYRIAQINGCARCQAFRVTRDFPGRPDRTEEVPESFYDSVERWREDPDAFTEREWLAIEFAHRYAVDHETLTHDDEFWDRLGKSFSEQELVDLGLAFGAFLSGGRFSHVFGTDQGCAVPAAGLFARVGGDSSA